MIRALCRCHRIGIDITHIATAIEEQIEYDGHGRCKQYATMEMVERKPGIYECGQTNRDHADADTDGDDEQIIAVVLKIHLGQNLDAGCSDHAEHHDTGTAEHELRDGGGHVRHFGE